MESIISKLCELLIQQEVIQEVDREVYEYSFSVLILNSVYYLICFVLMLYYQTFLLPILFTTIFLLLRSYMGGWHANTMWGCMLLGLLLFTTAVNIMIYPDITGQGKLVFSGFVMLLTGWSVYHFGIQDHKNRPLSSLEKIAAQKKCYKLLLILSVLMIGAALLHQIDVTFCVGLACFAATILLLLAKTKKEGKDET